MEHQKQGLCWMNDMEGSFRGGILADEMGLGKTIQALSLIALRGTHGMERHATLVITPAGLLEQWKREIEQALNRGGEKYKVYILHGGNTKRHFRDLNSYDIVLTTYGTVSAELPRRDHNLPILGPGRKWYRVILDEAHFIKNEISRTAKACCAIDSMYRWCLSGTPVMNNLSEICSLLKFLRLKQHIRAPDISSLKQGGAPDGLAQFLDSVILRRTKESTIQGRYIIQLLPKVTEDVYVTFSEPEQRVYSALEGRSQFLMTQFLTADGGRKSVSRMLGLLQRLRQACCHPFLVLTSDPPIRRAQKSDDRRRKNARRLQDAIINRLKCNDQILDCPICWDGVENTIIFTCGHSPIVEGQTNIRCPTCRAVIEPAEATDYWSFVECHSPPGARELDLESLLSRRTEPHLKSGSPSHTDALSTIPLSEGRVQTPVGPEEMRPWLTKGGFACLRKQVLANPAYRGRYLQFLAENWVGSSKVDKALEIVDRIHQHNKGEKIIIFSQFTSVLDLLEVPLIRRNYRRYDGSMKMKERQSAIEDFTNVADCTILLMSLRAGNAGLNLTAASHVIIFEPFWNPYIEDQAVGRVHRIGQHKQVRVYRILIRNTVEDRILRFQDKKRELTQQILKDKKDSPESDIRRDEFAYLFLILLYVHSTPRSRAAVFDKPQDLPTASHATGFSGCLV
ncbi:SNF2 family N-terminal domain-containing protein [Aspergillus floccosus]